jgi:hypothetical protein
MGCINKLTAAVSYDCTNVANRAKSGLEAKAVLINKSDIDLTNTIWCNSNKYVTYVRKNWF